MMHEENKRMKRVCTLYYKQNKSLRWKTTSEFEKEKQYVRLKTIHEIKGRIIVLEKSFTSKGTLFI